MNNNVESERKMSLLSGEHYDTDRLQSLRRKCMTRLVPAAMNTIATEEVANRRGRTLYCKERELIMERVNSRCNPELKQLMNFHTEAEIERENKLEVDSRMQLPKFDAPVCVYGN